MFKILIVEDNKTITKELSKFLEEWGYKVQKITDFNYVYEEFLLYEPHLILLDISLPYKNGYFWCQEIRKTSTVPIIFISSTTDNMNQVMALNYGGDDYITKPFHLDLVLGKIKALLRRTYDFFIEENTIHHKGITLSLQDTRVSYKENELELTKNEFKIFYLLLNHKGQIVSREKIMKKLWESESFIDDNTLTVNINRLRKELEKIGIYNLIETKRGMGYYIEK